ncbi:LIC13305 family lipoprotein [Leptospira interrogans]|uniref:LIC13305 family lipoprotein n=1 Tax=Leptospira interrogans TaxID=173 RepID=UPI000B0E3E6D
MSKALVLLFLIAQLVSSCLPKKEKDNSSDLLLSLLLLLPDRAENYDRDVEIVTHTNVPYSIPNSPFYFDLSYSEEDLNYYKNLLQAQIAKYPRGYWIKGKVEKVILVKYILNGGGAAKGLADGSQNALYLSVGTGITTCNCDELFASVIHHELMHNVDYSVFGTYPLPFQTPEWTSLNSSGFQYGSVYYSGTPATVWTDLINPMPGFLSYYGTSNVSEDRAIFASAIFSDPVQFLSHFLSERSDRCSEGSKSYSLFKSILAFWRRRIVLENENDWNKRFLQLI